MLFFFFNDTATTEIYTLSLHDALPICRRTLLPGRSAPRESPARPPPRQRPGDASADRPKRTACPTRTDRKSTRLNSSHLVISYAVFCLKKKKSRATHPPH